MYLFTFLSRMKIIHRVNVNHDNVNDLFRIFTITKFIYFITILHFSKDFIKEMIEILSKDIYFKKIYKN